MEQKLSNEAGIAIKKRNKMTEQERNKKIQELHSEKAALLDRYGIFGGGHIVNVEHQRINRQLEKLGMPESGELIPYSQWYNSQTKQS